MTRFSCTTLRPSWSFGLTLFLLGDKMGLSVQRAHESEGAKNDTFCIFDLVDIFPGRRLLINISLSIISLLSFGSDQENYVIAQCIVTQTEMRMLLPLLDAPTCCKPEVLQAGYYCTYEFLLKALISPDVSTTKKWGELVQQQYDRLHLAQQKKTARTEMRGVYNALFGLRQKLEPLGLTIRSRRDGYYLCKCEV
jgi:hypothetical protein